jgi:hypothetical protein
MEFSLFYTYTRAYVSHSSAATGIMCEPTDIAFGSTRYLRGTRRNDIMSPLQISSLLVSWTLLFVWPVWTTSFEHPLFGVKLEVILSWPPQ